MFVFCYLLQLVEQSILPFPQLPEHDVHNMPYDGQCGFSAIGHQMCANHYVSTDLPGSVVRKDLVNFISSSETLKSDIANRLVGETIDEYLISMAKAKTWIDENMLHVASKFYNIEVRITRRDRSDPVIIGSSTSGRVINLGYISCAPGEQPTHYVSLVRRCHPPTDSAIECFGKFTWLQI